jgi:hypothetical protein
MQPRRLAFTVSLVGVCAYSALLAQTAFSKVGNGTTTDCSEVTLTRKPGWTLSGSFTPDGSQLLIVDSLYNTILRYGSSGESLGPVGEPTKSMVADELPVTGKFRGEDFILEGTDGLMLFDKNFHRVTTKKFQLATNHEGWKITGLWEWQPVGKTDIVAFADIGHGSNPYLEKNAKSAFIRFPLQDPTQFEILQSDKVTGPPNKGYFRSTYTYITSLGETAYYLSMNEGLALYRQEKGKGQENISERLPKGLTSPPLRDWQRASDFLGWMADVEKESMPAGLFGWNGSLYLLYRTPQRGGTRWMLYGIDPTGKMQPSRVELPIQANHVTVIPGPQKWAFLEKGPVVAYGGQDISRALFISSDLLKTPLRASSMLCSK